MTPPIDLRPDHAKIVHDIIARYLPGGVSVRVFGSRAKWTAKPHSDLDLAVKGEGSLPRAVLSDVAEAFSESDLPFRVDVVDWHSVAPSFQTVIDRDGVKFNQSKQWEPMTLGKAGVRLIDCVHATPQPAIVGYPYIAIPEMKDGRLDFGSARKITVEDFKAWTRKAHPRKHDVVLSRRTNPGVTAPVSDHSDFALGQNLVLLRADGERVAPEFLRWLVSSPQWWTQIQKFMNVGAVFNSLKCADVPNFELPIPPKEEQRAIASTLSALDDKIELNRRMNATLERQAQAIFRDWFVDFGPVRRKQAGEVDPVAIMGGLTPDPAHAAHLAALFPNAFGDDGMPVAWKPGALGDIAQAVGETVNPSSLSPETPYFGLEHLPRCSIALDDWGQAASVNSNKAKFKTGQVLFGKLRSYFHKVGIAPIDGVCSTDIVVIDGKRLIDRPFVVSCASSKSFVDYTDQGSTGTKMPRTSWGQMKKYPIVISSELVRDAYSQIVQPMHDKIIAAVHERQALAETRDYLLPRLMSGTVRVVPQDRAAYGRC